jgi:HEAT repeat protein
VPWRTPRYLAVEALRPILPGFGKTHSRTYREQVETLKSILQHVVEVGDYEAKLWAAALLLQYKDTSRMEMVKQALLAKKESIPTLVRVELLSAVRSGAGQKQCIPALAELLSSQDVEVRRAAAYALREVADATAIPLYKQALYDADSEVRYHAVTSLADVTKSFEYPSTEKFRTNEQRYLDYWRNWQYQK